MRRNWPHVALALVIILVILVFGACSLTGPTCTQYVKMGDAQQRKAVLDWLVFNDMVDDREVAIQKQVPVAQEYLSKQCAIQIQQDIPTVLNQFRP